MPLKNTSLKINAISNWATLSVNIVAGFLLTPFIISQLGKTGYGIWTFIGSFIGYYCSNKKYRSVFVSIFSGQKI